MRNISFDITQLDVMEAEKSEHAKTDLKELANFTSQGKLLNLLPEKYVVLQCPLECLPQISRNCSKLSFLSLTITPEEIFVVAPENSLPDLFGESIQEKLTNMESDWKCFKVEGPLDFSLVGILHAILDPLKTANISVPAVGTYNTDYFLVKAGHVEKVIAVLTEKGFQIIS